VARKDTQLIFFAEVFRITNFYSEKIVVYVNAYFASRVNILNVLRRFGGS